MTHARSDMMAMSNQKPLSNIAGRINFLSIQPPFTLASLKRRPADEFCDSRLSKNIFAESPMYDRLKSLTNSYTLGARRSTDGFRVQSAHPAACGGYLKRVRVIRWDRRGACGSVFFRSLVIPVTDNPAWIPLYFYDDIYFVHRRRKEAHNMYTHR